MSKVQDLLTKQLLKLGYEPVDITAMLWDDSPGNWAIEFAYNDKDGRRLTESVGPKTQVKDLWWLEE